MVKKINPLFHPVKNGVYINGKYFGTANGYYKNGLPAVLNGCYEGGMFKNGIYIDGHWIENATGLYLDNVKQPFDNGVYIGGERQTNQFQQVLEELRIQYQPEHWASWALDGSLEEDRGQFPIVHQSPRLEWVQVGNRLGLSGALNSGEIGFQCGTNSDFNYVHNEREFTVGLWVNSKTLPVDVSLMGTNSGSSTTQRGFSIFKVRGVGSTYCDLFGDSFNRVSWRTGIFGHPEFIVARNFPAPASSFTGFSAAQPIGTAQPSRPGFFGDSLRPMSFLQGANNMDPPIIFNAFATSQVLTDAEIYKLYVAGLNDIQTF